MNTKLVALLVVAAGVALLFWFVSRQTTSESALEAPGPSKAPAAEVVRDLEPESTEPDHRRPPEPLVETLPPASRPELPPAPSNQPGDFWNRAQSVSGAIFDGTARAEDVVGLSKDLLAGLDLSSASKKADGTVEYLIQGDPAMGTAKLIVNPSRPNQVGEFVIEVKRKQASGYNGSASDVEGSQLQIHLGNAADGKWGFSAYVEDNLRIRDDAVWAGNANAGVLPVGGVLSTRGSDVLWNQKTAEAVRNPADGTPAWQIGFSPTLGKTVEEGGFSSDTLAGIQSVLATLPPR